MTESEVRERASRARSENAQSRNTAVNAFFGLAGVFIGSLISITGTYVATERQISAQDDQNDEQFLRQERRDAYGDFVSAFETLTERQDALRQLEVKPINLKKYKAVNQRLRRARLTLQDAQNVIQLVGSADCLDKSFDVEDQLEGATSAVIDLYGSKTINLVRPGSQDVRRAAITFAQARRQARVATIEFIVAARLELDGLEDDV